MPCRPLFSRVLHIGKFVAGKKDGSPRIGFFLSFFCPHTTSNLTICVVQIHLATKGKRGNTTDCGMQKEKIYLAAEGLSTG